MDKAQGIKLGYAAASADVATMRALLSALIADGDVKRRGTWSYFANKTLAYLGDIRLRIFGNWLTLC